MSMLFVLGDCAAAVTLVQSILEEAIVLDNIRHLPTAMAYLIGFLYAVNISYPKTLKCTFDAPQNIFMGIGFDSRIQRVRSLKNKLMHSTMAIYRCQQKFRDVFVLWQYLQCGFMGLHVLMLSFLFDGFIWTEGDILLTWETEDIDVCLLKTWHIWFNIRVRVCMYI